MIASNNLSNECSREFLSTEFTQLVWAVPKIVLRRGWAAKYFNPPVPLDKLCHTPTPLTDKFLYQKCLFIQFINSSTPIPTDIEMWPHSHPLDK